MKTLIFTTIFLSISIAGASNFSTTENAGAFEKQIRLLYSNQSVYSQSSTTRAETLSRAQKLLNYRFFLDEDNHTPSALENRCHGKDNWLRPFRLYNMARKTVQSIPYKWGGYFLDIAEFEKKLKQGHAVGDVCTCTDQKRNWCIVTQTIGLDCSGFVSHVWQIPYHVTSTMKKITKRIDWDDMLPGDAINKPGEHIILFTGFSTDGNYIHGIESSVRCEGICEVNFRIYDLKREGFFPIRYNNILD